MTEATPRTTVRELTDQEYADLNFDEVRCSGCTPCCMDHMHFLYHQSVLWACQAKLRKRDAAIANKAAETASPTTVQASDGRESPTATEKEAS